MTQSWTPARHLTAIVFPWRSDSKNAASATLLHWCLHLLFWSSLVGGLWYLNRWGGLERVLRSSWPTLHRTWLPLIALLVYALAWLSRGLWLSLERDPPSNVWPDLTSAWTEALVALERANVNVREAPAYLILGPQTRELQALLEALGAQEFLRRPNAPFQMFAHRDAVFVVCKQLSQLGMQGPPFAPVNQPGAQAVEEEPGPSRLAYLCELLALTRSGRKPIQGVILATSFSATQSDEDAGRVVCATQNDLRVLRQATGLEVPIFLVVSGMSLPATDAKNATAWLQRFPPLPDQDPAEIRTMLQEGVDGLLLDRIAAEVRSRYRLDTSPTNEGELSPALSENIKLYQWLDAVQTARVRLMDLLVKGTQNDYSEPGMVAGCYLLSGDRQDVLAKELGDDLLAHQQTSAWTAEMIACFTQRRRQTRLGYGLGVIGVCLCLAGVGWQYFVR